MTRIYSLIIGLFLATTSFGAVKDFAKTFNCTDHVYATKYVIVLVIDGPRYSETFGDSTHRYIPHLYNDLKPQSCFVNNFRNNGSTYTVPGHTAITTGVYQNMTNDGYTMPKNPSMFQYYLKEKSLHRTEAWVVSPKGKLNVLANTKDKDWFNQFTPYASCGKKATGFGYARDSETWVDLLTILKTHPSLMLINLLEPDVQGHANNWDGYLTGIKNTDEYAYLLWNLIQSDPIYKDKTSLFITNDHGRHLDGVKNGFVSHGDGCEGCRKISLLCLGPDFKTGTSVDTPYEQIDIAPTIGELLHFSIPTAEGEIMWDVLK